MPRKLFTVVSIAATLALGDCNCDSGVVEGTAASSGGLSSGATSGTSPSSGGRSATASGGGPTGTSSGGRTGSTSGAASSSTGSVHIGPYDAGCDQAYLTWTGPTQNTDGSCLYDLQSFMLGWGPNSKGPYGPTNDYPGQLSVGLPCTPGPMVACDGGSVVQLNCSYLLSGLADGFTDFAVQAVALTASSAFSTLETKTIACGAGVGTPCRKASDCPPYLACGLDAGVCTGLLQTHTDALACDSDAQCIGGTLGGVGDQETCINGLCALGCVSPGDCGYGSCCDLTQGSPGSCVFQPQLPTSQCLCAFDSQCNWGGGSLNITTTYGPSGGLGNICENNLCVAGCKTGEDCPTSSSTYPDAGGGGYVLPAGACDLSQGFPGKCVSPCQGDDCSCIADTQCEGGQTKLLCNMANGLCGPGCTEPFDCPSNEACNDLTRTCSATCGASAASEICLCMTDSQCGATETCKACPDCTPSDAGICTPG